MRKLLLSLSLSLSLSLVFGACAPSVPDNPTWDDDVRPILAANCVRCHTEPSIEGAPAFRFDLEQGAAASIERIIVRSRGAEGLQPMPPLPARELNDRQIEVLENWRDTLPQPLTSPGDVAGIELHELLDRLNRAQPTAQ